MVKIVGVRFKPAGKIYHFSSGAYVLSPGDPVIVETENGLHYGIVVIPPTDGNPEDYPQPLKRIYRPATEKDLTQLKENQKLEQEAFSYCKECIRSLSLPMNLFSVDSSFDGTKLTFFFTADGRVDFRKLVKMLAREYRRKIEMRQVGIRNQAKICGGMGRCGREICCSSFLSNFRPVTIKMAKSQGLSLNPTKISGVCGRLMCCLAFEHDYYKNGKHTCSSCHKGDPGNSCSENTVAVKVKDNKSPEL